MFDPLAYGEEIASLLALDGDGQRLMPLVRAPASVAGTRERVKKAQLPPVVRAGLYVYFDDWAEAHETAQDIDTVDGSYWHAIVHRQEPDAGNAGYWFRQVGAHPIFPELRTRALELALPVGPRWDPSAFIDYCGRARGGSDEERIAQEVQRVEWQLLFDWCTKTGA